MQSPCFDYVCEIQFADFFCLSNIPGRTWCRNKHSPRMRIYNKCDLFTEAAFVFHVALLIVSLILLVFHHQQVIGDGRTVKQ